MPLNQIRLIKPVKKLRKLLGKLDSDPAPEQVHDLRTNARRFEAAFVSLALEDVGIPKQVLRELRRIRKRAGKVRDMDVLTEFAAVVRSQGEEECHVRLLERLGARRKKQAGKLHAAIKQLSSGLRRELDRASSQMTKLLQQKGAGRADNAAANAAAMAVRLAGQLATPPRLNRTNLHPYRVKVKELQNILRMAETSSPPRFVTDLGEVKDAIGEWHDYAELLDMAASLLDHGGCPLLVELKRIANGKYDKAVGLALKLRKTYLQTPRPPRKSAASAAKPRPAVWEAMSKLAG